MQIDGDGEPRGLGTLRRALAGVRPSRSRTALAALLRLGSAASALAIPWTAGIAIGAVGGDTVGFTAVGPAALLVAAVALFLTFEFAATTVLAGVRARSLARLRAAWFDRLQRTRMQDVDASSRHDWLALLTQDTSRVLSLVTDLPVSLVFSAVLLIGSFAAMAGLSLPLASVTLVAAPVVLVVASLVGRAIASASHRFRAEEVALVRHTDQTFAALPAIKSFAAEDSRLTTYHRIAESAARLAIVQQRLVALMGPTTQLVAFVAIVVLAFVWNATVDRLETSELTRFVLYGLLLTVAIRTIAGALGSWSDTRASLERFAAAASLEPERSHGRRLDNVEGEITLDDVVFAYPDRAPVFGAGVSLRLAAGDTTVLIGSNGAGKTTLVALLLRFREPDSGVLLLDGVNSASLELSWYRRQFGVVHQDPVLMDGTVRDNVTLGRPDATEEEVAAACRAALLDELLEQLPRGLETRIGDGGAQLSGGQRQRVAIARAFLIDAPILVLDEATSMFDPESEERFIERNRALFAAKTVIWITHGEAAVAIADRVVEIRGGSFRAPLRPVEAHG